MLQVQHLHGQLHIRQPIILARLIIILEASLDLVDHQAAMKTWLVIVNGSDPTADCTCVYIPRPTDGEHVHTTSSTQIHN